MDYKKQELISIHLIELKWRKKKKCEKKVVLFALCRLHFPHRIIDAILFLFLFSSLHFIWFDSVMFTISQSVAHKKYDFNYAIVTLANDFLLFFTLFASTEWYDLRKYIYALLFILISLEEMKFSLINWHTLIK